MSFKNFSKKVIVIALICVAVFVLSVSVTRAAGLVPDACAGDANISECGLNEVFILIANVGNYILGISGAVALFMFVIGGLMFIFGGVANTVEKGKKMLTGAAVGLIIVLAAYLIVDFTLTALTNKGIVETSEEIMPSSGVQEPGTSSGQTCVTNADCTNGGLCQLTSPCPPENPKCGICVCNSEGQSCTTDSECCSPYACIADANLENLTCQSL